MTFRPLIAAIALCAGSSVQASPVTKERLAETTALVTNTVDQLVTVKGGIAGYSVVIAAEGQPDFILTKGTANAATGRAVTPDTAFYIASQTKSYTGLLAAQLDRTGIFPLETTMAEIWPGLKLPAPVDASKVTFRQLLSHSAGFDNQVLGHRTAYTDEVPIADYPRLIEAASTAGKGGFQYTNDGYLLYAAALQQKTKRHWKDWLQHAVLTPLALTKTYTRSSLVPAEDLAWGHQWDGSQWVPVPPKDDAIMHAAGGMFATSRDLAKWIRWQLREGQGQLAIPANDFRATHVDLVGGGLGVGGFGINCTGYSLGWSICSFEGERFLYHGGTYPGNRTHLFMLPDRKVGVAISANSDGMTGTLGQFFMSVIASSLIGKADAADKASQMMAGYRDRVGKQVENRRNELAASLADIRWEGWAWQPDSAALEPYVGIYRSPLYGVLRVTRSGNGLAASLGVMRHSLRPAKKALFGMQATPVEPWVPVAFKMQGNNVLGVTFDSHEFARVN